MATPIEARMRDALVGFALDLGVEIMDYTPAVESGWAATVVTPKAFPNYVTGTLLSWSPSEPDPLLLEPEDRRLPGTLVIVPQARVKRFRLDIVVDYWRWPNAARMAVECDGHDFHERTKEQAAHDRARDRFLTSNRFPFFRFTGSEIYRNADRCAGEVIGHLIDSAAKEFERALNTKLPKDGK